MKTAIIWFFIACTIVVIVQQLAPYAIAAGCCYGAYRLIKSHQRRKTFERLRKELEENPDNWEEM